MGHGRPTKYKEEYCEMLIEHMSQGLSYESFAGLIKVAIDTLYEWQKVHPAFSEAKSLGKAQALLLWEKEGIKGLWDEVEYNEKGQKTYERKINNVMWVFNMKNRFGWRDKTEAEVQESKSVIKIAFDPSKLKDE